MTSQFHKYQALGNDMIVINPANCDIPMIPETIKLICDRHLGLGADGICYGPLPGQDHPHTMRFFNPDGSEAEKSGNGLRIFARYLWDQKIVAKNSFSLAMSSEIIPVKVLDDLAHTIVLGMGKLRFYQVEEEFVFGVKKIKVTTVSIGNPHAVIFNENLEEIHRLGPLVETAPQFPHRTNVQLVHWINSHSIRIAIWERGAGYTLASGTSCSAAAGAAVRSGHCQSPVEVQMSGGSALVTITDDWQVELEGTVTAVYQATLSEDLKNQIQTILRKSQN